MVDMSLSSMVSRGESNLLGFISSVMSPDLTHARETAFTVLDEMDFVHPWAFEFTPASSESPSEAYLRRVEDADFVVWLIGGTTTPGLSRPLLIFASGGLCCDSMRPARWPPPPWLRERRGLRPTW